MALIPVQIQPGIYTESSARSALNRFKDGNNVHFFKGNPQKIAGSTVQIAALMSGVCRAILSWTTTTYERLIGFGTNSKLYLSDNAVYFDVTPVRLTVNPMANNPFATTNLSATIVVTDVANGASVGDHVTYSGATVVAGLNLNADQTVAVIIDADHYQFESAIAANATTNGGGAAIVAQYDITSGNVDSVLGTGWGAGGWGVGTWGTPRVSGFLQLARIWSLVNWGEDMVASPVDRPIYIWLATGGTATRAVLIPAAPAQNRRVLVSDQIRIMISFGSHDGTNPDPMLIRWCDSEDYTDWTPTPTNLAGDKRLDRGSEIITALQTRGEFAVFTNTTVYSMALSGDNNVFTFDPKGNSVGLVGPNAACDVDGVVYAMGWGQFYTYDGQIKLLPCDVHSRIFDDFNITQAAKTFIARNKIKSEILIFYCSGASMEIDKCAGYNFADDNWWLGNVARTAWTDENSFFAIPFSTRIAAGTEDSQLMLQENGNNDDVDPLSYFLETYDIEISGTNNVISGAVTGAGEFIEKVTRIFPDFVRINGDHKVTLKGKKYPTDKNYMVKGPRPLVPDQRRIDMHMRARQMAVRLESEAIDTEIEIGSWRLDNKVQGQN
jgi:hypothetical protein